MTKTYPGDEPYNELDVIDWSIRTMLLADGDRDHMNSSAMTCNQSMVVCSLLRHLRAKLYPNAQPI